MLLNITILSILHPLQSIPQFSPFYALPAMLSEHQFSFKQINYIYKFSPFLYGKKQNGLLSFTNSHFSQILSSAIKLENDEFAGQVYTKKLTPKTPNLVITDCKFYRCASYKIGFDHNEGGAILLRGVILKAKNCIFRKNYAYKTGGAIRVSSSMKITIENCLFAENNCSYFAAALSCFNVFKATVKSTNFTLNECQNEVSAASFSLCPKVTLEMVNFFQNTAKANGTLYIERTKANLSSVSFYHNTVPLCNSIRIFDKSTVSIENAIFSEQKSPSICLSSDDDVKISKSKFAFSETRELKKASGSISITDCEFSKPIDFVVDKLPIIEDFQKEISNSDQEKENKPKNDNKNSRNNERREQDNINDMGDEMPVIIKPDGEQQPMAPLPIQKKTDKSTYMMIAYGIVIALLVVGLRMYFQNTSGITDAPKDNSIFVKEDFDNGEQTAFTESMGNEHEKDGLPSINAANDAAKLPDLDYEAPPQPK